MAVTREHLAYLCNLSALYVTDEQMDRLPQQLDSIVGLLSQLEFVEVDYHATTTTHFQGHANDSAIGCGGDMMSNIKHPIVGNMPSISFSTRGDG